MGFPLKVRYWESSRLDGFSLIVISLYFLCTLVVQGDKQVASVTDFSNIDICIICIAYTCTQDTYMHTY